MVSTRSSDLTCRGKCHPCLRAIVERAQVLLTAEPIVVISQHHEQDHPDAPVASKIETAVRDSFHLGGVP
jgi:hypothetical protein